MLAVLPALDAERANCVRALTLAYEAENLAAAIEFENWFLQFLMERSYWSDCEKGLQLVLATKHSASDADTTQGKQRIGITFNNLGIVYQNQGQWVEAEECYQKSLEIRRELGDRVGEGQTLMNLALFREAQENIASALEFGRQAIAVLETTEDKAALEKARRLVAEWQSSKSR